MTKLLGQLPVNTALACWLRILSGDGSAALTKKERRLSAIHLKKTTADVQHTMQVTHQLITGGV